MDITYTGIGADELASILERGTDEGGNRVEPFTDDDGGWPLRCCLRDSCPGDRLAIMAFSPFPWVGPYRETGPIVVHSEGCPGKVAGYPSQFDQRDQIVRAFGDDAGRHHTQVYGLNRMVRAGDGLEAAVREALGERQGRVRSRPQRDLPVLQLHGNACDHEPRLIAAAPEPSPAGCKPLTTGQTGDNHC